MANKTIAKIGDAIPDIFKESFRYIKGRFEEDGKDIADAASIGGLLLKIFAKPVLEKLAEKLEKDKLKDFGVRIYLQAALKQAELSIHKIETELSSEYSYAAMLTTLNMYEDVLSRDFENKKAVLVFQPKFHPVVQYVRSFVEAVLIKHDVTQLIINDFLRDFNENIESAIRTVFGDEAYGKHIKEIEKFLYSESETQLLLDTIKGSKIGFREDEHLDYEVTFAEWKPVYTLFGHNREESEQNISDESKLNNVTDLIEEYFSTNPDNNLERVLFLIADFGKGKSIFLRHYASTLAENYLQNGTGFFPIYFNLRNFENYKTEHKLGVVANYLLKKYGIKIDDDYFKNKKYVFLIDSLDESGKLTAANIENVISSVKRIQNIDEVKYKTNRIIITSRPFDDGLKPHLERHKPKVGKVKDTDDVPFYISLYGFKKEQFNNWLKKSLGRIDIEQISFESSSVIKHILESVRTKDDYDIHHVLIDNGIVTKSELRRPIFAYMIYQLIANGIDFTKIGKIGVYLSFLNLLTKDAKHIYDRDYKINLQEQYEARNILNATAAVWMYNKNSSNKTEIKKADVCRFLEGIENVDDDYSVLNRYEKSGINLEFLSHSHFGESNNTIHFQHQSFAEILLAEYYFKVLIKFSLDYNNNINDIESARLMLSLGEPTAQTMEFLKEMILLFRDCVTDKPSVEVIEKRKLLIPTLASLASKNSPKLYSYVIYYEWFKRCELLENTREFPIEYIINWPIDVNTLNKIVNFCSEIIKSESILHFMKGEAKSSLFNKEIFVSTQKTSITNIDKWITLFVGNHLFNQIDDSKWFNRINGLGFNFLFPLILETRFSSSEYDHWKKSLFMGIDMGLNKVSFDFMKNDLSGYDFSYSHINNVKFDNAILAAVKFNNCVLSNVNFAFAYIIGADFTGAKFAESVVFQHAFLGAGLLFPNNLWEAYYTKSTDIVVNYVNFGSEKMYISNDVVGWEEIHTGYIFKLFKAGIDSGYWTLEEIYASIDFENELIEKKFQKLLK